MLDLNSQFSCLKSSSSGITGMCHHTWLRAGTGSEWIAPLSPFLLRDGTCLPSSHLSSALFTSEPHLCAELLIYSLHGVVLMGTRAVLETLGGIEERQWQ